MILITRTSVSTVLIKPDSLVCSGIWVCASLWLQVVNSFKFMDALLVIAISVNGPIIVVSFGFIRVVEPSCMRFQYLKKPFWETTENLKSVCLQ